MKPIISPLDLAFLLARGLIPATAGDSGAIQAETACLNDHN